MIITRRRWHVHFGTATRVIATLLATMHAMIILAPLAERAESTVAAVHVEQAGTSTHHAHSELCALCAASHLVAPPGRAPIPAAFALAAAPPSAERRHPSTAVERLDTRPRAPPA
jgi:hypothetical protein